MSLCSTLPSPGNRSYIKSAAGRPTKLTPETLSILAELLDSGVPESPTHLLKLLSNRGVTMSRPTVFKAIDKLGRDQDNIKWKGGYNGLSFNRDMDRPMCRERSATGVGYEASTCISSLEKYVFGVKDVLDLRTASNFCNAPLSKKPTPNHHGGGKITATDEEKSDGSFIGRHFSLNGSLPLETNNLDRNRRQTNSAPLRQHSDILCHLPTVNSNNRNLPLRMTDPIHVGDGNHIVPPKEENRAVAPDSTLSLSPRPRESIHSPLFSNNQPNHTIQDIQTHEMPRRYHLNDEFLHRNTAFSNYSEWMKQALRKPNDFIPSCEDRDLWLEHDKFSEKLPAMRGAKLNTSLPSLSPTNDLSNLGVKHRHLDFDMHGMSRLGRQSNLTRQVPSSQYPKICDEQNTTSSHITSSTSQNSRSPPHTPPLRPTSLKARPAFPQSVRLKPYEIQRSKSNQLWTHSNDTVTSAMAQPFDVKDKDSNLTAVLQDVVTWMQNISHRMETLEHQVQCFMDNTHSKGYIYTPDSNLSSPSGHSMSKSYNPNSDVPPLNSPESEALIGEIVNDCHWDQWRPFAGAPRLAIKLAKECVFGTDVLRESTVTGRSCKNPLDKRGLDKIRDCLRHKYGPRCSEMEFEMVWKQSRESISQLCKRLRKRYMTSKNEGDNEKDQSTQMEEEEEDTNTKEMPNLECEMQAAALKT